MQRAGFWLAMILLTTRLLGMPLMDLLDNTESRYTLVGRDMAAGGDWLMPQVWQNGAPEPYLGKPPLHFWWMAATMRLLGVNALTARLPTFLAAILIVWLMHAVIRKAMDADTADAAAWILAATPLYYIFSGMVIVDLTLALCAAVSVFSQIAFVHETAPQRRRIWSLAVFAGLGLGMLAKGPIALVIFGIPVVAWSLWQRSLLCFRGHAWGLGLLVFAGIAAPWYCLVEREYPGFIRYFFIHENVLRYVSREYGDRYGSGHVMPRGMAAAILLAGCLPWALWLTVSWWKRGRVFLAMQHAGFAPQFLICATLGYTLFLCFARQLLAPYLLPVIPFVAAWLAWALRQGGAGNPALKRAAIALTVVYAAGCIAAGPYVSERNSSRRVIDRVAALHAERGTEQPLLFVHRLPFSAYVYGNIVNGGLPREIAAAAWPTAAAARRGALFILREKDIRRVPADVLAEFRRVDTIGVYGIYEIIPRQGN